MMRKIPHVTDLVLTQSLAREQMGDKRVIVTWYTNKRVMRSTVHSHPFYEVVMPFQGCPATYYSEGIVYRVYPGQIIIMPKERYHIVVTNNGDEVSDRIVVQIQGEFWDDTARALGVEGEPWHHEVTILGENGSKEWDLRGLFERMNLNCSMEEALCDEALKSNLSEFFVTIAQISRHRAVFTSSVRSKVVERAVRYIETHFTEPGLNVDEVVYQLGVSRGHLSRLFKEYTSVGMHAYITDLRMQEARKFILDGEPILNASLKSGFNDYSSFLKMFKKLYGMTPMEFKSSLRSA